MNSTGKSMQGVREFLAKLEWRPPQPNLSAERFVDLLLDQRHVLVPDPDGTVTLGHGGTILVMDSRDVERFRAPGAARAEFPHMVVLDESHRVGGLDPVTTAAAMEALRSLAKPMMSPSDALRASDIQSAHKPNRKARRQAQRAARRLQRRN